MPAVLHVLGIKDCALGLDSGADDERVIPREAMATLERECLSVKPGR